MGGMGPLMVVKGDPSANTGLGLRTDLPGVQIDALIFQGSPEAPDEDVVETKSARCFERRSAASAAS